MRHVTRQVVTVRYLSRSSSERDGTARMCEAVVEVEFALEDILQRIANKAARNATGRATTYHDLIHAKVIGRRDLPARSANSAEGKTT
jgi:hypothetical protein